MRKKIPPFRDKILRNRGSLWKPSVDINYDTLNTNSWFNIKKHTSLTASSYTNHLKIKEEKVDTVIKCFQVQMFFTSSQQKIMSRWMMAYKHMYNMTIAHIKEQKTQCLNFQKLRTLHLKDVRNKIIKDSQHPAFEKNTKVKTHMLDGAIKLACANYKSAIANLKAGHIKKFRIRYWRFNKPYDTLDVEQTYFHKDSICKNIFGQIKCQKDGMPFSLDLIKKKYKSDCRISYDRATNRYTLLVPETVKTTSAPTAKQVISLDPGIRTFMTGLSENEVLKIGENVVNRIAPYIKKVDKLKNYPKIQQTYRNKIKNLVTELHWKTINHLTNTYKTILIGDLSIKGITKRDKSVLTPMSKRVGYALSFYKFRQRLQYKSLAKGCIYATIDESYTSKMCSWCGNCKENLFGAKVYECQVCNSIMDRDVNGCRGIYLKST